MWLGKLALALIMQTLILAGAQAQPLRIALQEDPDLLDPALARLFTSSVVLATICDRLFVVSPDGEITPQLAIAYQWSEDHRSVTFDLRDGVRFQDGEPFNAAAVKYNFERSLGMPGSTAKSYLGPISGIEVLGEHQVRIDFSSPYPGMISTLISRPGMMVSPKAAKATGDAFGRQPVCAGPYKFVERVAQDRIVVERFPDYWDRDNIFIDRIVFRSIPDTTVRFANLRSGDLDIVDRMAASDYVDLPKYPRVKGASVQGFSDFYSYVIFNVGNGPRAQSPLGRDPRVREAFELAIDRPAINDIVFGGSTCRATSGLRRTILTTSVTCRFPNAMSPKHAPCLRPPECPTQSLS